MLPSSRSADSKKRAHGVARALQSLVDLSRAHGWFKVPRKWMECADLAPEPFTEREVLIWSVESAAFHPHPIYFQDLLIHVERGEIVTSYRAMAAYFGWTVKRVRTFTRKMEESGRWALRRAHHRAHAPTIITVCGYSDLQAKPSTTGTPGLGSVRGGEHNRGTVNKEGKEKKRSVTGSGLKQSFLDLGEGATAIGSIISRHGFFSGIDDARPAEQCSPAEAAAIKAEEALNHSRLKS